MSQDEKFVASLCDSKRLGICWHDALSRARAVCPPRGRDAVPSDGALFDAGTGVVEETGREALERFCFDAWHGLRPALAHFSLDMMGSPDYTRSAKITGTGNYARAAA